MTPSERRSVSILSRLPWLLAMESLILVVIVYPLFLKEAWLISWVGGWEARSGESWLARLAISELEPLITFHFSPLLLKGTLAAGSLVIFVAVLLGGRFLRAFAPEVLAEERPGFTGRPFWAYGSWLLLILWMALSVVWSPTRDLSRAALPWLGVFGLSGYLFLRRGLRLAEIDQLAVLLMLLGSLVGVIVLLEAARPFGGAIFNIFYEFDDPRNVYGSLMGHNTAVGSFMLMTLFPALSRVGEGERVSKILSGLYAGLALVVIVVVQSRAVWLIGPVLIAAYVLKGSGWSKQIVRRTGVVVIALLLLAVISQAIPAAWNPLYLHDRPVARRLQDFSIERLQKETRLRLLVCSLPLIGERPLMGHGLYAFQYVYPKAQADYFARHPDTSLGFTNKRSHMAHNEYLQMLIEHGFPGLILLFVVAFEIAYRGWRSRDSLDGSFHSLHAAFGFSALGLALGAGVDFPLHIPQLVLPWMLCLAAFASPLPDSGIPLGPPSRGRSIRNDEPKQDPGTGARRFRVDRVFGLTLALIVICLVPMANYGFVQSLAVDTQFLHASSYLATVRKRDGGSGRQQALSALQSIIQQLRYVMLVQPSHGHARLLLGEAHYTLGRTLAEGPSIGGQLSSVQAFEVAKAYEAAIQYAEDSTKTLRTHHSYYVLALCYRSLAEMAPANRQAELLEAHARNLERSVYFAPGYGPALYLLAEYLAGQPDSDRARIARYRKSIRTHDPVLFRTRYLAELDHLMEDHDWPGAVRAVEAMLDIDAADTRFLKAALDAHLYRGGKHSIARLLELCDRIASAAAHVEAPGPEEASLIIQGELYRHLVLREWEEALGCLKLSGGTDPERMAWLWALEMALREEIESAPSPAPIQGPPSVSPEAWERMTLEKTALVESRVMDNPRRAFLAVEKRLNLGDDAGTGFWADAVEVIAVMGTADAVGQARERLRRMAPRHSLLQRESERETRAGIEPQLDDESRAASPGFAR